MSKHNGIRLIAGLGNPGDKHQQTRHNAGFWFVETLAKKEGIDFKHQSKFRGEVTHFSFRGEKIWLLKPLTYMNESGESLRAFSEFYKLPTEQILVAHDEIDLPNGAVRLKWAGGHGGHNGLRSIFSHLNQNFWRLRLGVDHPGRKEDVIDYVLKRPSKQEHAEIDNAIDKALAALDDMFNGDMERAMKSLHTKE